MTAITTAIVLSIMYWFGATFGEPICSVDDPRYNEYFGIQVEKCQ